MTRKLLLRSDAVRRRRPGARVGARARLARPFPAQASRAEVEDFHLALARQHEVLRLDVAVDRAALEGVLQLPRRLAGVVTGVCHGQRTALLDELGEADP